MKQNFNIVKSALIIGALFLIKANSFSQGDLLELLPGSETLEYDEETGRHRLTGNVNFLYQGNKMYCDSAHYFAKNKTVRAYGHVHINKRDTLNLFCDSLFYDGKDRKATLWGNVRVRDNEYKLTTDTLHYDTKKGQAYYHHGGKVESILTKEVLTSRIGYFHPNTKNFFFSKNVVYKGVDLTMTTDTLRYVYSQKKTYFYGPTEIQTKDALILCESGWYQTETGKARLSKNASISREKDYISGDTLIYNPDLGESEGIGNVYYLDSTEKISFKGDYGFMSDTLNYSFLTGRALAIKELKDDTVYIHADTLYTFKLDSSNMVKAYHGARIYATKFQGRADSLTYSSEKKLIEMYYEPIVWAKNGELKGDYIEVQIDDTIIHQVNIFENATILMEVNPETYYNQIGGKKIEALFNDNDIYRAYVHGNATTIFFPEEEVKTDTSFTKKRIGMNRLYASELRVDIDSSEITGITYIEKPDGAFYPLEDLKKDQQFVQGFLWLNALRPTSIEALFEEATDQTIEEEPNEEIEEDMEYKPLDKDSE